MSIDVSHRHIDNLTAHTCQCSHDRSTLSNLSYQSNQPKCMSQFFQRILPIHPHISALHWAGISTFLLHLFFHTRDRWKSNIVQAVVINYFTGRQVVVRLLRCVWICLFITALPCACKNLFSIHQISHHNNVYNLAPSASCLQSFDYNDIIQSFSTAVNTLSNGTQTSQGKMDFVHLMKQCLSRNLLAFGTRDELAQRLREDDEAHQTKLLTKNASHTQERTSKVEGSIIASSAEDLVSFQCQWGQAFSNGSKEWKRPRSCRWEHPLVER